MSRLKILVLEESTYLRDVLDQTLREIRPLIKFISKPSFIQNNYGNFLSEYKVLIVNLDFLDTLFPKFLVHDKPKVRFPPTLGITNNANSYEINNALNKGVDDCITYPFHKESLIAKIRALARRSNFTTTQIYRVGDFKMIPEKNEISSKGELLPLSKREYMILSFLLENPNQTVTKKEILKSVWISGKTPSPNTIDAHISHIRKKLKLKPKEVIRTVHGIGYKIHLPNQIEKYNLPNQGSG